jgi:hypothetical protein
MSHNRTQDSGYLRNASVSQVEIEPVNRSQISIKPGYQTTKNTCEIYIAELQPLAATAASQTDQKPLANVLRLRILAPKKYRIYTKAHNPMEIKPIVAIAHFIVMSSIIRIPRWESAAAITKEGIRKAAIAEAATLGYESGKIIRTKLERLVKDCSPVT